MASTLLSDDLFTTNKAPTHGEQRLIEAYLAVCNGRMNTLTGRINELEAQLKTLNHEMNTLLQSMSPYKRALAPIRRVPEDVIREIFVACLAGRRHPSMAKTSPPVLLTQICSTMRRVAISTPVLWSGIHIPVIGDFSVGYLDKARSIMATRAEGVREWLLNRSGNLPLHIYIHAPRPHLKNHFLHKEIVDIVLSCCSRWSEIYLDCLPRHIKGIPTLTPLDVPILRTLYISSSEYEDPEAAEIWGASSLQNAPMLNKFGVWGPYGGSISDYPINYANLTHITFPDAFTYFEPTHTRLIARILQSTTRLASCCIPKCYHYDSDATSIGSINLPFLKVLAVGEFVIDGRSSTTLLASINAPGLEVLSYNASREFKRSTSLLRLLEQVSHLRELSVGYVDSEPDMLIECLRYCTSLTTFQLDGRVDAFYGYSISMTDRAAVTDPMDAFISEFVKDDEQSCICPQLEYFRCNSSMFLSLEALRSFISRKRGDINHLRRWKAVKLRVLYSPSERHVIDELGFEEDVTNGMKLFLDFQEACITRLDDGIPFWDTPNETWPVPKLEFSWSGT